MLLMYVVIGALSTLAMAPRARHASTYPFGVRYPYPTTKKERAQDGLAVLHALLPLSLRGRSRTRPGRTRVAGI